MHFNIKHRAGASIIALLIVALLSCWLSCCTSSLATTTTTNHNIDNLAVQPDSDFTNETKFCQNLVSSGSRGLFSSFNVDQNAHPTTFKAQDNVRYPFWIQCYNNANTNYYGSGSMGLLGSAEQLAAKSFVVYSNSINISQYLQVSPTIQDERHAYLIQVAQKCESHLLEHCQTFRLGLLGQGTAKCAFNCGLEENCENLHQCSSECGYIKSINYPYNYGNNHRCRWSIRAPDTHYVNLSIIDFDIPSTNNANQTKGACIFDSLTLIDGYTGKRLGCFCNENLPPPHIVSPWNELIIQFDTNSETTGRGFYVEYKIMKLEPSKSIRRLMKPHNSLDGLAALQMMTNSSSSTTDSNGVCKLGWQYFRGNCYKAFTELEPLQWYDAESKCNNEHGLNLHGHLVSILDKDEMLAIHHWLTNVWKSARYQDYYIGLIDVTREGVYRWSDSNPMSYTDWQLRPILMEEELLAQPDGGAYEDCTIIKYNSFSRTSNWHDVPCSLGKHFHSHLDRQQQASSSSSSSNAGGSNPVKYKLDYVNSYICKTDTLTTSSLARQTQIRRPLFHDEAHIVHPTRQPGYDPMRPNATATPNNSSRNNNNNNNNDNLEHDAVSRQNNSSSAEQANAPTSPSAPSASSTAATATTTTGQENNKHFESTKTNDTSLITLDRNRYFVCDNSELISDVLRCDGIAHCRDGSDESNGCDQECLDWQFKCANGRCIPIGQYCDFLDDCGDGSDESRCERVRCKLNEFRCQSGQCIMAQQRCDLLPDCGDSSDEGKLCTIGNCNTGSTFQCYNGNCIPNYAVCDFQIDCPGKFHEDEDIATCEWLLMNRTLEFNASSGAYGLAPSYHSWPIAYYLAYQDAPNAALLVASDTIMATNYMLPTTNLVIQADSSNRSLQLVDKQQQVLLKQQQQKFECTSGNLIEANLRCLYEFDRYGYQIGCRDVSHLIDCEMFECPKRDYVKCSNSYCIPWRYVCDGKWDCIGGDDEAGCSRYVCPGQYKCAKQSSCILLHQLCDGHRQCPLGDDEWFCDLNCPSQCECIGQSINCARANLTSLATNFTSKSVRRLDLSYNRLGPSLSQADFTSYHDLGELILHHNNIESLTPRKFSQLRNLYKLDLSYNKINSLRRGAFAGLRRVTQLLLESNPELEFLEPEAFLGLSSLQMLNISSSRIIALRRNTFDGLTSLRNLLLRSNMIVEIEDGAFRSLSSLVSLDMRGNEIRHFTKLVFNDLKSLRNLSTDSFKFCCLINHHIPADRCLPLPDEISDCEDLLSSVIQRTCIWVAGIASCIGNSIVIVWRYKARSGPKERKEEKVNSTLLLSLACSDLLMGIYLIIIATVDTWYRGRYIENSDNWRESTLCTLCGFLSTVSSIVSVFTLVTIAYNRYTEICGPLNNPKKFTLCYTYWLIFSSWSTALAIAMLPLIITSYFRGTFYTRSGVCLAFHITNQRPPGWQYSIVVFQGLYSVAFLVIVRCYTLMYMEISRAARRNSGERPNHPVKILLILLTSFIAWSPTIILRLISLAGIALPAAVYSWIAVLVLPVNSAINPLIYTIPSIKRQIKVLIRNHRARRGSLLPLGTRLNNNNLLYRMVTQQHQNHHHATAISEPILQPNNKTAFVGGGNNSQLESSALSRRNVPKGYVPICEFIRQADELNANQLAQIAMEIAKDIEIKSKEARVYAVLDLERVFVSNKVLDTTTASREEAASDVSGEPHIKVYIADYEGYRTKGGYCNHKTLTPSTGSQKLAFSHSHQQNSHRRVADDCGCSNITAFGDILLKLIQCYRQRKLDRLNSS